MIEAQPPQATQSTPYTPDSIDPLVFEEFDGMDTATLRPGVDDKKAAWFDGFMPLARRNLRTMYGLAPALYTATTGTITCFDFGNIGNIPYAIVYISDGSIYSVNTQTGSFQKIANPGTISNPARTTIGFAQYGSRYFIIVAQQTNGYFVWDGTVFYNPGQAFPAAGGSIPLSIGGTAVEVYTGRVWIANGATITFSAPGSIIDFSSADGGGNFTSSDSFLRVRFIQLRQTNGFLYLIADSSVNYISGVQTSGSSPITTFTNQNADPEVGSPWPGTVDVFSRNILLANAFGAHVSYGGAVTKISEPLDGVYNTVPNFGNIVPSAAKAIIFGKKCWVLLLPIIDPITGQQTNKLFLTRDPPGKIWWATQQDVTLVYIQFQEINSILTAWGTDGVNIYQLFGRPSVNFTKTAQTKLWDKPGGYQLTKFVSRLWGIVQYYSNLSPAINVSIDNEISSDLNPVPVPVAPISITWINNSGQVVTWLNNSDQVVQWVANGSGYSVFSPDAVSQSGVLTGFTLSTNAADMALVSAMIQDQIAGNRG